MLVRILRSLTWEYGHEIATFRKDVDLPFAPGLETVLVFGDGEETAGPFVRVVYNCEEEHFVCTMASKASLAPNEALFSKLATELWTRIK